MKSLALPLAMKSIQCVNLRNVFGKQYQISFDPAYDPLNRPRHSIDPWMMLIPCERGVIYPFGGKSLCVEVIGRPVTANRLAALPCCKMIVDGEAETAFRFDVQDFAQVAAHVKPRRRRRLREDQRKKAVERLKAYQFQSRRA